jgi:hypothetical protein
VRTSCPDTNVNKKKKKENSTITYSQLSTRMMKMKVRKLRGKEQVGSRKRSNNIASNKNKEIKISKH